MNRSEVYFLMKLVEKSEVPVPAWVDRDELLKKLQNMWIQNIHSEKQKIVS